MPELPDVAAFKKYLDATSLHQEIEETVVENGKVLRGVSAQRLREVLAGRRFESSRRHGKNLLVSLDKGPWLRLHFGMTGALTYYRDPEDTPAHARVVFRFAGGFQLAYVCMRMLGRVSLTENPSKFAEEAGLGPDALDLDYGRFKAILAGRRGWRRARPWTMP